MYYREKCFLQCKMYRYYPFTSNLKKMVFLWFRILYWQCWKGVWGRVKFCSQCFGTLLDVQLCRGICKILCNANVRRASVQQLYAHRGHMLWIRLSWRRPTRWDNFTFKRLENLYIRSTFVHKICVQSLLLIILM